MQFWNVSKSHHAYVKMSAPTMCKFLSILKFSVLVAILSVINNAIFAGSVDFHDYFLCRKCGHEIVQVSEMVNIPSKLAMRQRNDTFRPKRGVLIQLFKNPHGVLYEVVTSKTASVLRASKETGGDTWWPGFNWIILGCPQCRQHIGWEYIPQDKTDKEQTSFYGLVLGNLLYENDADNLIVLPKSYNS
ncbi:protein cereblon-like [Mercenaria mercenaria]|uniref:protein cereblon-like n=1 Tax=Mercenaria mercenaria TaxID=6596 RepID=UPI00234FACF0|nr:protein cereblon-like [Mercenaria mercenaria]